MGILNMFFRNKEENTSSHDQTNEPTTQPLPEIKESIFIDQRDPIETTNTYTVEFGSKLPIDIIYAFLREDYESKAYQDAITSPDRSYREKNLSIIKSNLEQKFQQVLLKYEDMLRDIDYHIVSRSQNGLTDIVELLKSKKETYIRHVEAIRQMKVDLENNESYISGVFLSYEVGFTRGLASLSLHNLKINDNQ